MYYNWDKMTDTQKIQAIDKELSLETHMGVTKDDLINMIRYMRGQFEVEKVTVNEPSHEEVGKAMAHAFECGYVPTFDGIWTLESVEKLLEWSKEQQT